MGKPNWKKFQKVVNEMVNETMGGEPCTVTIFGDITYDMETGEEYQTEEVLDIKCALIPTNKDDLRDLPEGNRDRETRKVFTIEPIPTTAIFTSLFDNTRYEIIVPSVAYQAGGLTHCYRTMVGKIETDTPLEYEDNE